MISIIVPVFNSEKYLNACFDSIIKQSYQDFEVIVIDDGSTDQSQFICEEYIAKDSRFKLFAQSNRGASAARNYGLTKAKGEYITFVDSDDILPPYFLFDAYENICRYKADIVIGGYRMYEDQHDFIPDIDNVKLYVYDEIDKLRRFFLAYACSNYNYELRTCPNILSPWGKLFRKPVLSGVFFMENLTLDEDTIFNLQAFDSSDRILLVPSVYYIWRINPYSVSRHMVLSNVIQTQMLSMKAYEEYVYEHMELNFHEELYIRGVWSYVKCLKPYYHTSLFEIGQSIKSIKELMYMHPYDTCFEKVCLDQFMLPRSIVVYCKLAKSRLALLTFLLCKLKGYAHNLKKT